MQKQAKEKGVGVFVISAQRDVGIAVGFCS
jgi:hypothetical protein